MITLNQLVYHLKNLLRGGRISDDETLSDRQLEFIINYTRAKLIKQDVDKQKKIDDQIIQSLGSVKVKLADPSECADIVTGIRILRTEKIIPATIECNDRNLITYIGSVIGDKTYDFFSEARTRWSKYDKLTGKMSRAFFRNGYIYITENKTISTINIRAVFEDPREVTHFRDEAGKPCFTGDSRYPIPGYMVPVLTELILSKEFRVFALAQSDGTNDANPTFKTPGS